MQLITLIKKELLENWRNFKWLWFPIVFVILAVIDPVTNYYLPEIIDSVGNLPEGAVFDIPPPTTEQAVMMSLEQLGSLGILILVLAMMGTIAQERKQGIAELLLTKPVRFFNYVLAKWLSWTLLLWVALSIAFIAAWYYIHILYGELSFLLILKVILFYGLWLTFVM